MVEESLVTCQAFLLAECMKYPNLTRKQRNSSCGETRLEPCDRMMKVRLLLTFFLCAPLVLAQKKESSRVMGLVELYGISASIIYGEEDEFAANLLLEFLKPELTNIKTIPAQGAKSRSD